MHKTMKALAVATTIALLGTSGAQGQAANYLLDNGLVNSSGAINASDGTETRDNWFANEFTAQAGAQIITRVDFYSFTTTPGTVADVVLYQVTGAGGNPALGATRLFTQAFTPPVGNGTNIFVTQVQLTGPVVLTPGSKFLVAIFVPNVIAKSPNDVYPFLLDTSGSAVGSYWDRSNPNMFNLDNISGAMPVNQVLAGGTWDPGADHLFIRAYGVPEPSVGALSGLAVLIAAVFRRRRN